MIGKILLFLSLMGISYFAYDKISNLEYEQPDGILISDQPQQILLLEEQKQRFVVKDWQLEKVAGWAMRARVLGKKTYFLDDISSIAPVDVAFGWGPMSDNRLLKKLDIGQGGRFFYVSWDDQNNPPAPKDQIMHFSANMHLIPANKDVEKKLKNLRRGELAEINGFLVNLINSDGASWLTSTKRTDTGAGSCEIIYVTNVVS